MITYLLVFLAGLLLPLLVCDNSCTPQLLDDTRERWFRLYDAISEALEVSESDWPRALEILQEAIQ